MHPVVFTDIEETDTHVCDEGAVLDNENVAALVVVEDPGSLPDAVAADMLCVDVFYALVGCGIAYVLSTY